MCDDIVKRCATTNQPTQPMINRRGGDNFRIVGEFETSVHYFVRGYVVPPTRSRDRVRGGGSWGPCVDQCTCIGHEVGGKEPKKSLDNRYRD